MKNWTRIDVWTLGEYCDFMDWAAKQEPKPRTREDMVHLLAKYRKADSMVEEYKERVEHIVHEGLKQGKFKPSKRGKK